MAWTLITGASGGIGAALARIAAAAGHDLVLAARSGEALERLADELGQAHGIAAEAVAVDLSEAEGPERLWQAASRDGREIGVLVNNAGLARYGAFATEDAGGWPREAASIALNVHALTALTKRAVAPMVARGEGRILNVSSVAGWLPGPGMAVYNATKAYVTSFSESLAAELAGSGVTVTCLAPGVTRTNFQADAQMAHLPMVRDTPALSAEAVAKAGWRGLMAGRRTVIPGAANKAVVMASRTAPRALLAAALRRAMLPDRG